MTSKKPKSIAFTVTDSADCTFDGIHLEGFDEAFDIQRTNNSRFNNVRAKASSQKTNENEHNSANHASVYGWIKPIIITVIGGSIVGTILFYAFGSA